MWMSNRLVGAHQRQQACVAMNIIIIIITIYYSMYIYIYILYCYHEEKNIPDSDVFDFSC